jgi:hypothetical protein
MPQQEPRTAPDTQPEETVAPENPPTAVVHSSARSAALVTFLGGILLVFLLFGAILLFWKATDRPGDRSPGGAPIGTSGEPRSEETHGGFEPAPSHESTDRELEYRGVDEPNQRPTPGLTQQQDGNQQKDRND